MAQSTTSQSHEWWKDKTDKAELTAFVASCRSSQREQHAVGWRRNMMLGLLCVSIPLLLRMVQTL